MEAAQYVFLQLGAHGPVCVPCVGCRGNQNRLACAHVNQPVIFRPRGVSAALTSAATRPAASSASGYEPLSLAQTMSGNWTENSEDLWQEIKRIRCRSRTPRSAPWDATTT